MHPLLSVTGGILLAIHHSLMISFIRRLFSLSLMAGSMFVHKHFVSVTLSQCHLNSSGTRGSMPSTDSDCPLL
jgi:hypothetical protein